MGKRILIIGNGAREHALAWAVARSPDVEKIFVAPGNGGTEGLAENVVLRENGIDGLIKFAREAKVTFTVVGPEDWLERGIVDAFQARDLPIFGPAREAARIETSKMYAKLLMRRHGIPTAESILCTSTAEIRSAVVAFDLPCVIKADGLARGKGVFVCHKIEDVEKATDELLIQRRFGIAGELVIVEEFLPGEEVSIQVITDGRDAVYLPSAQDHKALRDGGDGPNTGGMGAIAPVPWLTQVDLKTIDETIIRPTLDGLSAEGRPFTGCLYAGLKMTEEGPKVLEFNARFGDPEACVILPLIACDVLELLERSANGTLGDFSGVIVRPNASAATVVLTAGGYPEKSVIGDRISGIEDAAIRGAKVFHAATSQKNGLLATNGGRVLDVTAWEETLTTALTRAYDAVDRITFEGMQYRRDIGANALRRSSH